MVEGDKVGDAVPSGLSLFSYCLTHAAHDSYCLTHAIHYFVRHMLKEINLKSLYCMGLSQT